MERNGSNDAKSHAEVVVQPTLLSSKTEGIIKEKEEVPKSAAIGSGEAW